MALSRPEVRDGINKRSSGRGTPKARLLRAEDRIVRLADGRRLGY